MADKDGWLSGLIAWGGMKSMAKAVGRMDRKTGTFEMTAVEFGKRGRTAKIEGAVRPDGWLLANVTGPRMSCSAIAVPPYRAPPQIGQ